MMGQSCLILLGKCVLEEILEGLEVKSSKGAGMG